MQERPYDSGSVAGECVVAQPAASTVASAAARYTTLRGFWAGDSAVRRLWPAQRAPTHSGGMRGGATYTR